MLKASVWLVISTICEEKPSKREFVHVLKVPIWGQAGVFAAETRQLFLIRARRATGLFTGRARLPLWQLGSPTGSIPDLAILPPCMELIFSFAYLAHGVRLQLFAAVSTQAQQTSRTKKEQQIPKEHANSKKCLLNCWGITTAIPVSSVVGIAW